MSVLTISKYVSRLIKINQSYLCFLWFIKVSLHKKKQQQINKIIKSTNLIPHTQKL